MPNIQLEYLYRDGANYKQFGSVVFSNSSEMTKEEATHLLRSKLISGDFFIPQDWDLPRLHYHPYDLEIDHEYHEFEEWEVTKEEASDPRDVSVFFEEIQIGQ